MIDYDALAAQNNGAVDTSSLSKVFVGVISQGVLGEVKDFVPVVVGLITSMDQLQQIAHDNGSAYVANLPGKLHYTISFSSSFKHPDGSVEQSQTQKIVTGYTTKGVPKYKTIRNKFAKMTISIKNDAGILHKISEINLGAVDATAVNPTPFQLTNLQSNIQANIVTKDTGDFHTLVSPTTTEIVNTPPAAPTNLTPQGEHVAQSFGLTPEQLLATGVKLSTTRAEAENNQIPVRFFLDAGKGVGFPKTLYVGTSTNVPFGTQEIDAATARALIQSIPNGYLVEMGQRVNDFLDTLGLTRENQGDIYAKLLVLTNLSYPQVTSQQILSGNLPATGIVWAYKDVNGNILTQIPLTQIPNTP